MSYETDKRSEMLVRCGEEGALSNCWQEWSLVKPVWKTGDAAFVKTWWMEHEGMTLNEFRQILHSLTNSESRIHRNREQNSVNKGLEGGRMGRCWCKARVQHK